jgi:hypothetical protein
MWLVANFVAALVLGVVLAAMAGPSWFLLPVGAFIVLALIGLGWESIQLKLYRAWNRAADFVRKEGFRWTLHLSHRVLLRAMGPEGSKFDAQLAHPIPTGWTSYQAGFSSGASAGRSGPIDEAAAKSWARNYVEWARNDDNRWALLLLPFLLMLALFSQDEENATAPSNIYTLF